MDHKIAIVWFRQDLRLHDNEALTAAIKASDAILPVYVFDERVFKSQTQFGFPKTGAHRLAFVLESVADLREQLRKKGADLIVRVGKPEEVLFDLARRVGSFAVFCNRERTSEEVQVQDALEKNLWSIGQEIKYNRGKMLYYTSDLPFPVSQTPDVFTQFRKEVEKFVRVREPLPVPDAIAFPFITFEPGTLPEMSDFGWDKYTKSPKAALQFEGGETKGLERLKHYLWDTDKVKTYKLTRNELLGADYSSKFSPWLAQGCLSPKQIYHELKKYEAARGGNESTYWLFFELLWRDYFRLIGKKYGCRIFQKGGIQGVANKSWTDDRDKLFAWVLGETGIPFIDANMKELRDTGFMSNRGRQNVASFLVKDLKVNWQMGAEYFESALIDYDPCSNYGNWNYVAGVGNDPRENRYFNILSQAKRYDPDGAFVRHWLPELAALPSEMVHQPDQLSKSQQEKWQVVPGKNYPKALVSSRKWAS
ncbi:MAG: DASH family cryptochrome [Saprospiraceae bacterium]|jgi:deoxyribodipyrimidine photo-lyase|nr:DASH family cryptochrome [Saprospiraceae bacterium]